MTQECLHTLLYDDAAILRAIRTAVRLAIEGGAKPDGLAVMCGQFLRVPVEVPLSVFIRGADQGPMHSEDFRSVICNAGEFIFTPTQAAVIRVMWEAWGNDMPDLGHETILEAAGSEANQLRDVFKTNNGMHPAWGVLVVGKEQKRGVYRLNLP